MSTPRFEPGDVSDELLVPGVYPSTITAARIRWSQSGNRMVHIVHALDGVPPGAIAWPSTSFSRGRVPGSSRSRSAAWWGSTASIRAKARRRRDGPRGATRRSARDSGGPRRV